MRQAPSRVEFATATKIIFGPGTLREIGPLAREIGKKALVTAGFHGPGLKQITGLLAEVDVACVHFPVSGEPTVSLVQQGVQAALDTGCDFVIGFGGGSALDTGKAVAALMTNPGEVLDYLEVVGRNMPLQEAPAPFVAIPTTAGTGSEVTRNAVLAVPEKQVKVSLRSPLMLARVALVDPELTYSLPPEVTASTGMDALAQLIEPYVSRRANPLTDPFCREGIGLAASALLRAFQQGTEPSAREKMSFASLLGGISLANAGLGAVHGFAGPIGGMYNNAPHGAVCAALLPPVVLVNCMALAERESQNPALARYEEVARLVTGDPLATISELVAWLENLRSVLGIPGLRAYGITEASLDTLIEKGAVASSMKANPLTLSHVEMKQILEMSL